MMICEATEAISGLGDLLFPPTCPTCGAVLVRPGEGPFCADCASTVRLTISPLCPTCGVPFPAAFGEDHLCEECILSPPPFTVARSWGRYEGVLLDAIHLFKYRGDISVGEALGRMMAQASYDSLAIGRYSLVIPVPLHPSRLRRRGFNQSLILAREVSRRHSMPLDFSVLRRTVYTEAQVTLSGKERKENVRGVFEVNDRSRVRGRRVLVIDDVYTTGSTVMECARVLIKNGAREVAVLTLARA
ncbi:MAG: ComF family protein [Deltaproteobacteria bacterium]|nr:ComF family protein [Deltaproteobacteria bacterium]